MRNIKKFTLFESLTELPTGTFIGTVDEIRSKFKEASGPFYHRTDPDKVECIERDGFDLEMDRTGFGIFFLKNGKELSSWKNGLITAYITCPITDIPDDAEDENYLKDNKIKAWSDGYQVGVTDVSCIAIVKNKN